MRVKGAPTGSRQLQNHAVSPNTRLGSPKRGREEIKTRLCLLQPLQAPSGTPQLHWPLVFPISPQQTRPVGKKRSKKQRGGGGSERGRERGGINSLPARCPSPADFNPATARSELKAGVKGFVSSLGIACDRRQAGGLGAVGWRRQRRSPCSQNQLLSSPTGVSSTSPLKCGVFILNCFFCNV